MHQRIVLSWFLLFNLLLFLNAGKICAQDATAKTLAHGVVVSQVNNEPIAFAEVALYRSADSVFVSGTITDYNGLFDLAVPAEGSFYIKISCLGCQYKIIYPLIKKVNNIQLGKIKINPLTTLKEIEIVDERPAYHIEDDKKVYRVDKDPASATGSTADILQNIPSVFVDLDGNVKLRGGNARILINGKPSSMLGISRKEVLEFIPANMIESVEIISNPSAKYDASGEAGIINIVLKKPKERGLNALLSASAGTGDKYNGSGNIAFHNNKVTIAVSENIKSHEVPATIVKNRTTTQSGIVSYHDQFQDSKDHNFSQTFRSRVNYNPNDKNEISVSFLIKSTDGRNKSFIRNYRFDELHVPTKIYDRQAPDTTNDRSQDFTFGYTKKFKKKDEVLSADFTYNQSDENTVTSLTQKYYNPVTLEPFAAPPLTELITDDGIQYRSIAQLEFTYPFTKNIKTEAGIKTTYRYADLDYNFQKYDFNTLEYFNVPAYTNHYKQTERINAAYITFRNKHKGFSYKAGLRAEQSVIHSEQATTGYLKDRDYIDFFPSIHLQKKSDNNNNIGFSYSRRINRPAIRTLNPFLKQVDDVTIRTGNPNLKPEYTHSLELSRTHSWKKSTFNSSIYYRYTSGTVQKVSFLDTAGVAITTYDNFKSDQDFGAEVYLTMQPGHFYRFNVGLNGYRSIIDGSNIDNIYKSANYNFNAKINNYFTFGKSWVVQLTANYVAPVVTPINKIHEVFFSDLSVQKDFFHKKLSASIRLSDIFNTRRQITELDNPVYFIYTSTRKQTRVLFFSITYRILLHKAKEIENLKDEEQDNEGPDSDER